MLSIIARTRPIRSPSQPNSTPPVAAPTRKPAVMMAFHRPISALPGVAEQVPQGRPGDEREQAHLQAVEHPAQQGGGEGQPPAARGQGGRSGWGHE